ncbi:hypothetical protein CROQUDRAFT_622494 [Cronartium quercuum f. sp. fusiforme G11]|uniref:Uncharacterized protein n=1 Tax=Cronartium quercuum f. sp. fusiforme G11 TaxID=708437 RepID=A0A9P6NIV0_9BASI|nr:hypothetical protein CROQUDRAFT_622494 [Cronartium quercuum f. sp. fusiforme G11]
MLLRSLTATLALTACVVKGFFFWPETGPALVVPVAKGLQYAPKTRPTSVTPVSTLTDVTVAIVKLQELLKIIVAGGQSDACRSSIISLASPLKLVLEVFINAGVDVYTRIRVRVDLDFLASIGVSLGINGKMYLPSLMLAAIS